MQGLLIAAQIHHRTNPWGLYRSPRRLQPMEGVNRRRGRNSFESGTGRPRCDPIHA